ncbi:hypothetical protein GPECTOR_10g1061 [Gonium pectorale]|uniref:Uncharacterized protein n=1 Tax=Gonium pectorale TaxID=33097 RepID=A0A150GQM4_GONPE|nr:hypothetical protein GPECTOR_10g1061 [Gonium pectorale]|eukprot:KXZ52038.1 hypothetical protein GPECTOR_10g1061 [Gonium pectorale]
MLDLQKKLDTLLQEHAVVEAENTRLKTRLRVLEAVLPVRERAARLAQQQPARPPRSKEDQVLASLLDMAVAPSSCCGTSSPRRVADVDFERKSGDEDGLAASPEHGASPDPGPCNSGVVCSSYCCGAGEPTGATASAPAHPHNETEARWIEAWRTWIREAALLLQAHDARPNEMYVKRLDEAFLKLKAEVVYLGLKHPELVCNMRQVNMETGMEREVPPEGFWSVVAAGMKLTPTQIAECRSALGLYRERMAVVLSERRGLASQLSCCLGALQLEEADGRALPGSQRREQLTLEAEEVAHALDANVATEGHTTSLARDLLGSSLFSRVQTARASVLSYPYFPDALAIITTAVMEAEAEPQPASSGGAGAATTAPSSTTGDAKA